VLLFVGHITKPQKGRKLFWPTVVYGGAGWGGKLLATNFNNSMHSINAHKQQQSPPFVPQTLDSNAQILLPARTHTKHSSAEKNTNL